MQDYMKNTGVYGTSWNIWKITDAKPHTHHTQNMQTGGSSIGKIWI